MLEGRVGLAVVGGGVVRVQTLFGQIVVQVVIGGLRERDGPMQELLYQLLQVVSVRSHIDLGYWSTGWPQRHIPIHARHRG